MHHFEYRNGEMFAEDVPVKRIAKEVGTPAYVYSLATLKRHFRVFDQAFAKVPHIVCFSVKANSNIALLRTFAKEGSGFDIVSGGELFRALKAGGDPKKIVFSGVGKKKEEIEYALDSGILMFNVESEPELVALNEIAGGMGKKAPISLRINPDVDPQTHPYISTGMKKGQIRHRDQTIRGELQESRFAAESGSHRCRLPHWLPAHFGCPVCRCPGASS